MKNIIILLLLLLLGWQLLKPNRVNEIVSHKTVTRDSLVRDTICDTILIMDKSEIVRLDTLIFRDTIEVSIPISRYEFKGEDYKFVVEGYNVKPISMEHYPITHYKFTSDKYFSEKRISFGIIVGVGGIYGVKGADFGLIYGIGFRYRLN